MTKLKVLDLFSGLGAFTLGLHETGGFDTAAFCEIDPHARAILSSNYPDVKIYEDVTKLTAAQLRADGIPSIDAICGGFPCQDASIANVGGSGAAGERTGLFKEVVRLARELGPEIVVMENVTNLLNRGFGDVLGALAEIGFDAEWDCISARDLGFDHQRDRLLILAYPQCEGRKGSKSYLGTLERAKASLSKPVHAASGVRRAMAGSQRLVRIGDGFTVGMERRRLHALGNAVIPQKITAIGHAILEAERAAA